MWGRMNGLRVMELGTPGKMRTWLTDLALSGAKQGTAGLLDLDYHVENEPLEHVGEHLALVGDDGTQVATIEITAISQVPFSEVTWEFADSEGEGYTTIDDWRESHRRYWRAEGYEVNDSTIVVCVSFRVVNE